MRPALVTQPTVQPISLSPFPKTINNKIKPNKSSSSAILLIKEGLIREEKQFGPSLQLLQGRPSTEIQEFPDLARLQGVFIDGFIVFLILQFKKI